MSDYREEVKAMLGGGWTFAGLYAASATGPVRAAFAREEAIQLETVAVDQGAVPSIVDLVPAAGWDEREAHDIYDVRFDGHEPLRPLVDHDLDLGNWTVAVQGQDVYQVAVGPIHAGVIESGHFRFHLVGEKILHLDARLFYKRRGLEQASEGSSLDEGARFVARACAACAVTNGVAYAQAVEHVRGMRATPELARARTLLLELERLWSHLNDVSAICSGTGLAAGAQRFAALTERARRLNARLTGHRFLFGSVAVGGSRLDLDENAVSDTRHELDELRAEAASGWRELLFNRSFQDRLPGVGIVRTKDARRLGATGPSARASGLEEDVRAASPGLAYSGFAPVIPSRALGDAQARLEQRQLELEQSFALLGSLLDRRVVPSAATNGGVERHIGVSRVESPRGATLCVVERDGDRIGRVHLRTGSYANWPVVAFAAAGNMLPDFPLINKSFELCYACVDR